MKKHTSFDLGRPIPRRIAVLAGALCLLAVGCSSDDATVEPEAVQDTSAADAAGGDTGDDTVAGPDVGTPDTSGDPDAGPTDVGGDAGGIDDVQSADGQGVDEVWEEDTSPDADTGDTEDTGPVDPCAKANSGTVHTVTVPLGETLFLDADDYLTFWAGPSECTITLESAPDSSTGAILDGARLTPDMPGDWTLRRGPELAIITVDDQYLNADTFLNYNYTPVMPLVKVDEDTLLVASPPSNAVQVVKLVDGEAVAGTLIPTGGWPTSIALIPDSGTALVAQTARDSIGILDLQTMRIVDAIRVGNEPAGILVDGATAWVTLSGADRVIRLDLESREVTASFAVGRDPRAMVLDADAERLYVASLMSSNEHPQGLLTGDDDVLPEILERDIAVIDTAENTLLGFVPHVGTMIRGLWMDGGTLVAAVSHSHNEVASIDAEAQPHRHGLAFVTLAETPSESTVEHLDLDSQESSAGPAPSPFTMRLTPDESQLAVTLSAGAAVLVLDPTSHEELLRIPVGNDPRGLVYAGGKAWTYAWLDNQLVGMNLPLAADGETAVVPVGADPTPLAVKQGQRIFNDAAFSKYGDFSCNNCHIDGLTDGLVWDLLVDGNVNTLAFRNVAGTNPFLWGGFLPTLFDFSREVLKLVGADATGEEMEMLTIYMQSVTAPPNPYAGPGGRLTAQAELGKTLFEGKAGCGGCHSGPLYTNKQTVTGKTPGLKTDVPSLIGVYDSAPYGRQGDWVTLDAMVDFAIEFTFAQLTTEERDALLAYVQQIPGDALYLNSARPLNGDAHVWYQTPVELVFSQVLTPGQEDHFTFSRLDGDTTVAVAGAWELSGRVARFIPDADLELETAYVVDVGSGLVSALGQVLKQPLTLTWETGGVPAFDVSGKWTATVSAPQFGVTVNGEIAFLQSSGGKVAGVLLTEFDEAELSHVEGVVSGTTLVLDSFLLDSVIGDILVDGGLIEMEDTNEDGYADTGQGTVSGLGMSVNMTLQRLSLPEESETP